MKFNEFLNESKTTDHKLKIDEEEFLKLLKEKCKNMNLQEPIWRGFKNTDNSDFYLIEGQLGNRKSANTYNYYTIILDEQIKEMNSKYPLRSKSIICGNNANKEYAEDYGKLYAIFPYDDTIIGVCRMHDIWATVSGCGYEYDRVVSLLNYIGVPETNIKDMAEYLVKNEDIIKEKRKMTQSWNYSFANHLYNDKKISMEDKLKKLFNIDSFNFVKNDKVFPDKREMWIGGKCLAISEKMYEELLKKTT